MSGVNWAAREFCDISLGDERLNKRAVNILQALSDNPQASIPEASRNWSDAFGAYRFFDNDKVDHQSLLKPHISACLDRMVECDLVLAIQDTSSLNYTHLKQTDLGPIGDSTHSAKGLLMHTTYAVSGDGLPLGILDQELWSRKNRTGKRAKKGKNIPLKDKESNKWFKSLQRVASLTEGLRRSKILHVMDREGDIYDLFSEAKHLDEMFLIRSMHNRKVDKTSRGTSDGSLLFDKIANSSSLGTVDLEVNSKGGSNSRRFAEVDLRAVQFKVTAPRGKSMETHEYKNESVELTAIRVQEIREVDDPDSINWTLITNVKIGSIDDILMSVKYYCLRWEIEVFHRILKTGCKVEKCRFSTSEKIQSYVGLQSIIAWRIHWLTLLARTTPESPAELAFTKKEQDLLSQIVNKKPLAKPINISDCVTLLARLGGYLDRKSDRPPGAEVIWRGWLKLADLLKNLAAIEEARGNTYV